MGTTETSERGGHRSDGGFVYFLRGGDLVKVGWTRKAAPADRINELRRTSPVDLVLLAVLPALPPLERELHKAMAEWRVRGEWFRWNPLLARAIDYARCYGTPDKWGLPRLYPAHLDERIADLATLEQAYNDLLYELAVQDMGQPV